MTEKMREKIVTIPRMEDETAAYEYIALNHLAYRYPDTEFVFVFGDNQKSLFNSNADIDLGDIPDFLDNWSPVWLELADEYLNNDIYFLPGTGLKIKDASLRFNMTWEIVNLLNGSAYSLEYKEQYGKFLADLAEYGCRSGLISGAIYYSDTRDFFRAHKREIGELLSLRLEDTGSSMPELFNLYDEGDPFFLAANNQNLMVWYAIETIAYQIYNDLF